MQKSRRLSEIIPKIVRQTGMSRPQVKTVIDAVFEAIKEDIGAGNNVSVKSFGTFGLIYHPGGMTRHWNGQTYHGQPHYRPFFKSAQNFKLKIRQLSCDQQSRIYVNKEIHEEKKRNKPTSSPPDSTE